MRNFILLSGLILLIFAGNNYLQAQTQKQALTFDDVRQWRTSSVTLSDDGEWYTTLYSLNDKPELITDSTNTKQAEQKAAKFYQDDNQTDVLYICNSKDGVKYEIPGGSKPVFSSASDWIAYQIKHEKEAKKDKTNIELKNLQTGFTVKYESGANYRFLEGKNFFVSADKNSLLIYDLDKRTENYIGNIGEYVTDKDSKYIVYTIASEDKRGNGIYLFDLGAKTTRALETSNFMYSNLSWNKNKNALAAYKYSETEKKIDDSSMSILVISGIDADKSESVEYPVKDIKDLPENMGPAVKTEQNQNEITWSNDGGRLFLKIKAYEQKTKTADNKSEDSDEISTVQVWHWKDKKLLSERIVESENEKNKTYDAIFFPKTNSLVQLTGEEIQRIVRSEGTDNWAIGKDNREYISDWDVDKNDLYSINLKTGEKKLFQKKYASTYGSDVELSPDGEKMVFWDGKDYWCYDFNTDEKRNISEGLDVSFIDKEYDKFGFTPSYGFVAWVKKPNAVIVNHKFDLWLLPLDGSSKAQNLTASVSTEESIRFRFDELNFAGKEEIEERYIDLSSRNLLSAFNPKTKYAGFYNLQNRKLTELIYKPASFSSSQGRSGIIKAKNSDAIIYKMADYETYPEAYLSKSDFSDAKKITNTNPQQEMFRWGKRILIDYTNNDGVPLQGILSIPDGYQTGQKLPMMVYSYEKRSDEMYNYSMPTVNGKSVSEMFYVSDGYLFLQPDIHFNVTTPHSDMFECIDAAIEKVIELGYVDEKHIGYEGFSFGGHCGMYMSTQDNKFAAIAAGAGVSNLVQGFDIDIVRDGTNEQDYYMTGQGRLGADPTSNTQMYIRESAVFNANTMNTPLLLFHGTADQVVKWEHSFGFYNLLRYLQKPVVFLSYRGEDHGLKKEANRLDLQRRLKEYFDHYLKGAEVKKWMIEELPDLPENLPSEKEKDDRTLPKWK